MLTKEQIEKARGAAIHAIRDRDSTFGGDWKPDYCDANERTLLSALAAYERVTALLEEMPSNAWTGKRWVTDDELRRALEGE
jgi:hypothetical protein